MTSRRPTSATMFDLDYETARQNALRERREAMSTLMRSLFRRNPA